MPETTYHVIDHVVQSRFLVMQTKRLLLMSVERRCAGPGSERMRERVERLRSETELAADAYRRTVLAVGPRHPDYWTVAYSRMIHLGNRLSTKLQEAPAMPTRDRAQVQADVKLLGQMVNAWTESMRARIVAA